MLRTAGELQRTRQLSPGQLQKAWSLALGLAGMGRFKAAIPLLQRVAQALPRRPVVRYNLAVALMKTSRADEALPHLRVFLELKPQDQEARRLLGQALLEMRSLEEAREVFEQVLSKNPEDLVAVASLAWTYERSGQLEEAWTLLQGQKANLSRSPDLVNCFASVSRQLGRPEEGVGPIEEMLGQSLPTRHRVFLLHSLGFLKERLQDWSGSFRAHDEANRLRGLSFDPLAHEQMLEGLVKVFDAQLFQRQQERESLGERLVFIVGMPRSGTSLTEQILSSHSCFHGGGELQGVFQLCQDLGPRWPSGVPELTSGELDDLSQGLVRGMTQLNPMAARISDKHPNNFLHLGLIALLCPGARFIHCRRDPMDSCLSAYFQNFSDQWGFATSLQWLGSWYRGIEKMMAHWEEVLPQAIHTAHYEDLVTEPEPQIRALVAACGLEWEEACLSHHDQDRLVTTASYAQVREPIHARARGRSGSYRAHLDPLVESLGAGEGTPA